MNFVCFVVLLLGVVACSAAPGKSDDRILGIVSDNAIEQETTEVDNSMINFKSEPLRAAARYYSEARGKLKKYLPLKIIGLFGLVVLVFGGLSVLVTKAVIVSKLALLLILGLVFRKFFYNNLDLKQYGYQVTNPSQWTASSAAGAAYPYVARSLGLLEDQAGSGSDLAYKAQKPL